MREAIPPSCCGFVGIEKQIAKARDLIDKELRLLEFDYDYRIEGSELIQSGTRDGAHMDVTLVNAVL